LIVAPLLAPGHGQAPAAPSPSLRFGFEGSAPRILHAWNEGVVPVTVINTGTKTWNHNRVHLSYHWLWLIPRELPKRSRWNLPYHEGIRSELTEDVEPGGRLAIPGRLLAPRWPGMYWLQWDMVEEGAVWFSQVSPRQPRQLVVVLPTLAGLATPLPLLVALCALGAAWLGRGRQEPTRFLAASPLIWCATALLAKPLMLMRDVALEPDPASNGLILASALLPALLWTALLRGRARVWILFACGLLGTLVVLADELYYRFFGNVLSVAALFGFRQTGQVWGSIRSLLAPELIQLVIDLPFALGAAVIVARHARTEPVRSLWKRPSAAAAVTVALIAGGLLARVADAADFTRMFSARSVMEDLGPFGYHVFNAWTFARFSLFRRALSPSEVADVRAWFVESMPQRAGVGPLFGAAAGKNLIVIQVESLQDFVVDYRASGEPIMPYLARWTEHALRFTNVTDQTNEGRTSDAEFTTLVSLPPLDQGAVAFRFPSNHYVGLPAVLAEHGYATLSSVAFQPGFWNRRTLHPSYGFQQSLFDADFAPGDNVGWGLNDRDFLAQMVPRLQNLPRPFAAWLITLSLHHPFDHFPKHLKVMNLGALEDTSFGNYLHAMHLFDGALADFEAALGRAGLLDDTMLVVFGDHDAGFSRDLAPGIGLAADETRWELNDRVPFFVRLPSGPQRPTGSVPVAAGQTDLAPTLLALLGIDPARLPYTGRNLLGHPTDRAVLRPGGDWLDRRRLFIKRAASDIAHSCFALEERSFVNPSACQAVDAAARRAREIANLVVTGDLQQEMRRALSLPE
jgi:phosphoglycerol transferase MdoB-like AlkP superfamily enzyme